MNCMYKTNIKIKVKEGKIIEISPFSNGLQIINENECLTYPNSIILPGFVDSHLHFFGIGEVGLMPDLRSCKNEDEIIDKINEKPFYRNNWIIGFGWNQELFDKKKFPTKVKLDIAFPNNPIMLKRIDGHSALINSKALELLNIDKSTISPFGGIIVKDSSGNPTGLLIDNAMDLVTPQLPFYDNSQIAEIIDFSQNFLNSLGITEVVDMDLDPYLINHLQKMDKTNKLNIFINSFVKAQNNDYCNYIETPYFGDYFSVIGTKFYADGALGSRGAALHEPYSDNLQESGLLLIKKNDFIKKAIEVLKQGFAVAIHSIGDRAISFVLDSFDEIIKKHSDVLSKFQHDQVYPLRIEHCQMFSKSNFSKASELNSIQQIVASVQPIHFQSDFSSGMVQSRIGMDRLEFAYLWKNIIDLGFLFVSGSDAPIESPNPLLGMFNLMYNEMNKNQLVTPEIAIKSYTQNAYKSIGKSAQSGSIEIGKNANFTILPLAFLDLINNSQKLNIIEIQKSFEKINVISTIVNGKEVYNKKQGKK